MFVMTLYHSVKQALFTWLHTLNEQQAVTYFCEEKYELFFTILELL